MKSELQEKIDNILRQIKQIGEEDTSFLEKRNNLLRKINQLTKEHEHIRRKKSEGNV